jgi:carboxyl-terminal processing protease
MSSIRCLSFVFWSAMVAASGAGAQNPPARPLPFEEMQTLAQVFELLRHDLADPVADPALLIGAVRGMVRHADPEGGEYLTDAELKAQTEPLPPNIGWTGLQLAMRGFQITLLTSPETPATLAGIQSGDILEAVDGKSVRGLRNDEVVPMLRGAVGTKVRLSVLRAGQVEPMDIEVERHRRQPRPEARVSRPDAEMAVLRMLAIDDAALGQAVRLLDAEWRRRPFKGLVLDLRGNSGGPLNSAIGLASAFLPRDAVVVSTVGRTSQSNAVFKAQPSDYRVRGGADPLAPLAPELRQLPLVVLVDAGTASGAEIVTAALREHQRAIVVGRTTFGRGSIQTVVPLGAGRGAVKLTTAHWQTPQGKRFHKIGLTPDVLVPAVDSEQELAQALATLKGRLPS